MLSELSIERGTKYVAATLVIKSDDYEWHETYLCRLDEVEDDEAALKAFIKTQPRLSDAKTIQTACGPRLKIKNAIVWLCYKRLKLSEAKAIQEMKLLPAIKLDGEF